MENLQLPLTQVQINDPYTYSLVQGILLLLTHDPDITIYANDREQIVTETKNIDKHLSMNDDTFKLLNSLNWNCDIFRDTTFWYYQC